MSCCSVDPITFLGCHVISATCNLGFGGQPSRVNLRLVEPCGGLQDAIYPGDGVGFYSGSLGCVYTLVIGGFVFTGVLADHKYNASGSGFVWDVSLSDGRESLSNVSVILNDYYCKDVPVPNIINALAELEPSVCELDCTDFMKSFKDERGIPMLFILRAINNKDCVLPVCGVTLKIDVSRIINICPAYFKITDSESNVLQIIAQACNEAGFDFFIEIVGNAFVAVPIDKRTPPPPGALRAFMASIAAQNSGAQTDFRYGQSVAYEPSKKFVFGDKIHYLVTIEENDCFLPNDEPPDGGGGTVDDNPSVPGDTGGYGGTGGT